METIAIDGGALAYADDGSGRAVVLIHGFLLNHSIWDGVMPALTRRARVLRPDVRGLGESSVVPGPYLMETLAADVAALLDAQDIERATIVGHSLGGYIALSFFRMYRERVEALALVGSRFAADTSDAARFRSDLAERTEREGISQAVQWLFPLLFAPHVYEENPPFVEETRRLCGRNDPRGAAALLRGAALRVDSRDLIEDIDVPFLFSIGEADAIMGRAEAEDIAREGRARVQLLPGCGHMPMFEAPDQLAGALVELLESAGKAAAGS